jgi:hypothetical protein
MASDQSAVKHLRIRIYVGSSPDSGMSGPDLSRPRAGYPAWIVVPVARVAIFGNF